MFPEREYFTLWNFTEGQKGSGGYNIRRMKRGKQKHKSKSGAKTCYIPKTEGMSFDQWDAQEGNIKRVEGLRNRNLKKKHIGK